MTQTKEDLALELLGRDAGPQTIVESNGKRYLIRQPPQPASFGFFTIIAQCQRQGMDVENLEGMDLMQLAGMGEGILEMMADLVVQSVYVADSEPLVRVFDDAQRDALVNNHHSELFNALAIGALGLMVKASNEEKKSSSEGEQSSTELQPASDAE